MNTELLEKIKKKKIAEDYHKHDGSYELVQSTVAAYNEMRNDKTELEDVDYKDLDLIYFMTVGSWKGSISFEKKRNAIKESHLDNQLKKHLNDVLDKVITNAENGYYENHENGEATTGMFSATFQTMLGAANDKNKFLSNQDNLTEWNNQIHKFIIFLTEIYKIEGNDDEKYFIKAEESLSSPIRGIQTATASEILHCLKPYVFPIVNNKSKASYKLLDISDSGKLGDYISVCRKIRDVRDKYDLPRNYRAWDLVLSTYSTGNNDENSAESNDENQKTYSKDGIKTVSERDVSKNIILYGPPGTGKTYNTARKAVKIINGENWAEKDYKDVKNEYDKLLSEGRINFITFHQSYGYEEFIEGIKPSTDDGNVTYDVEPGVFSKFCDSARVAVGNNVNYGFNLSPTIWKVSLEGTGDNKTRAYCLNNGCIRVGFDSYGEDIFDDTDFTDGGKNVLNAFINDMRVGDIVLSCYTNTTIDGIGVVTGDYEWHNEFDRYKRLRKVKWIFKGKKDIVEINGSKTMTLSTVYRLNNITLADVLKIVEGADNEIKNTSAKTPDERGKYVFIIDEINRGNISKIFGELITLIEDNKREGASEAMSVKLPYSQKSFSVPDNVYIIGTMNTADRSITAIDTALRRRFTFEEMMPDYTALKNSDGTEIIVGGINIAEMLKKMNERIAVLYDREHTIGHAYFMPLKDNPSFELLSDIFRNKIIPLLQEYFYEDYGKIRLVLGDNQKSNDNFQFIKSTDIIYRDLFGNTDDDFGEKSKTYSINEEAFKDLQAYIGIYAQNNGSSDNKNE